MTERQNDYSNSLNTNFQVFIDRLPNVQFFLTDTPVPDVDVGGAVVNTRVHDFSLPGDKVEFGPLTIGFYVDEYWFSYEEVYNWLFNMSNPDIPENSRGDLRTDIHVALLDNNKNKFATVKFIDAFPTNLSGVTYNTGGNAEGLQAQVMMTYSHFVFDRIPLTNVKPPVVTLPRLFSPYRQ